MMNLEDIANPFDFANPVSDASVFIGRSSELNDIRYYLNEACKTLKPINLAIIGDRASGKTSLLNMIELEANKKDFCVVRINLDESDVETPMAFFYKIFDSVLTEACSCGAFEGKNSQTYKNYRNMVDAFEVVDDDLFRTFIFPIQYAKAMNSGAAALLSDTNFKDDITKIYEELERPICLIFDECDVLSKSRVHLQKIRNIFMNLTGYMLIITGTHSLFPVIDEVFSPIIRQFKKINVEPFREESEIRDSIEKPLKKVGIQNFEEIIDNSIEFISEINAFSGGRPYEIQLICHFMFRRLQDNRSEKMELTLDVLNDVLNELESTQDVSKRKILTMIQKYDKEQLDCLGFLCRCNGNATFEMLWFLDYLLNNEKKWTKKKLKKQFDEFTESGIINIDKDSVIYFSGDDFDKIYCKYFAKKQGVMIRLDNIPYELLFDIKYEFYFSNELNNVKSTFFLRQRDEFAKDEVEKIINDMSNKKDDSDIFNLYPAISEKIYWSNIFQRDFEKFYLLKVTINTPWFINSKWYYYSNHKIKDKKFFENSLSFISDAKERAKSLGGNVEVDHYEFPIISIENLIKRLKETKNERLKKYIFRNHYHIMIDEYIEKHNIDEALFHGELENRYNPEKENANNLGYIYLVNDDLKKANDLFEEATEKYERDEDKALPTYNLGVVAAKRDLLQEALEKFEKVKELLESTDKKEIVCACLISAYIDDIDNRIEFKEVMEPNLYETALSAVSTIKQLIQNKNSKK